jgi:hypothetical protein
MIDIAQHGSPGWWLWKLSRRFERVPSPKDQAAAELSGQRALLRKWESRRDRLNRLWSYYVGNPPLPAGAENARPLYDAFIRKCRANYAALAVEAPLNRMRFLGVRTDESGDDGARGIVAANGLTVAAQDVHTYMLVMGDGYVIVGPPDAETGEPVVTAEDPRQVITSTHPVTGRVRAALKLYRDDDEERDYAHVYLPDGVWVYFREGSPGVGPVQVNPQSWHADDAQSGAYPGGTLTSVPVTRFQNRLEMGEFEQNTDLLDRINDVILRRMVITTLQAFRQRALIGDLPSVDPESGEKIDYDAIFSPDPGALWRLPPDSTVWESSQADLSGIQSTIHADVKEFAATTQTPLHLITPDAASGSAEGAALMREALVFKVEDRRYRAEDAWARVFRQAFTVAGRADLAAGSVQPVWAPAERYSLAQRGAAAVQGRETGLPQETINTELWQFDPETVARIEAQRVDEALLAPVDTNQSGGQAPPAQRGQELPQPGSGTRAA